MPAVSRIESMKALREADLAKAAMQKYTTTVEQTAVGLRRKIDVAFKTYVERIETQVASGISLSRRVLANDLWIRASYVSAMDFVQSLTQSLNSHALTVMAMSEGGVPGDQRMVSDLSLATDHLLDVLASATEADQSSFAFKDAFLDAISRSCVLSKAAGQLIAVSSLNFCNLVSGMAAAVVNTDSHTDKVSLMTIFGRDGENGYSFASDDIIMLVCDEQTKLPVGHPLTVLPAGVLPCSDLFIDDGESSSGPLDIATRRAVAADAGFQADDAVSRFSDDPAVSPTRQQAIDRCRMIERGATRVPRMLSDKDRVQLSLIAFQRKPAEVVAEMRDMAGGGTSGLFDLDISAGEAFLAFVGGNISKCHPKTIFVGEAEGAHAYESCADYAVEHSIKSKRMTAHDSAMVERSADYAVFTATAVGEAEAVRTSGKRSDLACAVSLASAYRASSFFENGDQASYNAMLLALATTMESTNDRVIKDVARSIHSSYKGVSSGKVPSAVAKEVFAQFVSMSGSQRQQVSPDWGIVFGKSEYSDTFERVMRVLKGDATMRRLYGAIAAQMPADIFFGIYKCRHDDLTHDYIAFRDAYKRFSKCHRASVFSEYYDTKSSDIVVGRALPDGSGSAALAARIANMPLVGSAAAMTTAAVEFAQQELQKAVAYDRHGQLVTPEDCEWSKDRETNAALAFFKSVRDRGTPFTKTSAAAGAAASSLDIWKKITTEKDRGITNKTLSSYVANDDATSEAFGRLNERWCHAALYSAFSCNTSGNGGDMISAVVEFAGRTLEDQYIAAAGGEQGGSTVYHLAPGCHHLSELHGGSMAEMQETLMAKVIKQINSICDKYQEDSDRSTRKLATLETSGNQSVKTSSAFAMEKERLAKADIIIKRITTLRGKIDRLGSRGLTQMVAKRIFCPYFNSMKDANESLMACPNGVIDLTCLADGTADKAEFRAGKIEDYITKTTGTLLMAGGDVPAGVSGDEVFHEDHPTVRKARQYFKEVFPDEELCMYVYKVLAHMMYGKNVAKKVFFFTGVGNNSKSVLQKYLERAFGDYSFTLPPASFATVKGQSGSAATPDIAQGEGKRACFMCEPPAGIVIDAGFIKRFSGNDRAYVRMLYKDGALIEVQFKIIICCNNIPNLSDCDEATMNRVEIIPFLSRWEMMPDGTEPSKEAQFASRVFKMDPFLDTNDDGMAQALLWIMFHEAPRFFKEGIGAKPTVVLDHVKGYYAKQDPVAGFIQDAVVPYGADTMVKPPAGILLSMRDFHDAFVAWCEANEKEHGSMASYRYRLVRPMFLGDLLTEEEKDSINGTMYDSTKFKSIGLSAVEGT